MRLSVLCFSLSVLCFSVLLLCFGASMIWVIVFWSFNASALWYFRVLFQYFRLQCFRVWYFGVKVFNISVFGHFNVPVFSALMILCF